MNPKVIILSGATSNVTLMVPQRFTAESAMGNTNDEDGELIIVEKEAKVVNLIFDWYLQGESVSVIIKKLK